MTQGPNICCFILSFAHISVIMNHFCFSYMYGLNIILHSDICEMSIKHMKTLSNDIRENKLGDLNFCLLS